MNGVDPEDVASRATKERENQRSHAKTVLEWLLADGRLGEMYPRDDLITELAAQLDLDREQAASGVRGTVGDVVDPVQQVTAGNEKYVGVIEYHTYPDQGSYGYVQYHDRLGERKRVVCAKCVEEADLEENVSHATEGEGTAPPDCGWDALLERIEAHYDDAHNGSPDTIEPGASLLSNTTIAGNTAFHAGNDGTGSGLDADTLDGDDSADIGGGLIQQTPSGAPLITTTVAFSNTAVNTGPKNKFTKSATSNAFTSSANYRTTTTVFQLGTSGTFDLTVSGGFANTTDAKAPTARVRLIVNGRPVASASSDLGTITNFEGKVITVTSSSYTGLTQNDNITVYARRDVTTTVFHTIDLTGRAYRPGYADSGTLTLSPEQFGRSLSPAWVRLNNIPGSIRQISGSAGGKDITSNVAAGQLVGGVTTGNYVSLSSLEFDNATGLRTIYFSVYGGKYV